ncbi:MAG: hypothetical protein H6821_01740 [Planctomycetaceae bacterium]|nr:hypothetical protein [Planctomycetales bacterium]MCB9872875.1 hypothetical protein [Planctomycetaceae bacterium]MCB9941503.1 hypothetical protein [Planctomycetaceae bacterium]HRX82966.1 hypothetical protein [Pirellulaceae bacterium]
MLSSLIIGVVVLSVLLGLLFAFVWWIRREQVGSLQRARETFHIRREWLEADFVSRAEASGKPRGLRWLHCDFDDSVCFARDRRTGRYRALVGVTISFEAIEGGGMEDVEAVGNLRAATVVFRLDGPEWKADGRALFNLNPAEAIEHYQNDLETVE